MLAMTPICVKSLLKENFVEISDIVYSGTVLTRSYRPAVKIGDYINDNFLSGTTLQVVSAFISNEKDGKILAELDDILKQRIKELENNG